MLHPLAPEKDSEEAQGGQEITFFGGHVQEERQLELQHFRTQEGT